MDRDLPQRPEDVDDDEPRPPRSRWSMTVQGAVVLGILLVAFLGTVGTGHTDSAMVFVGIPTLLALMVALSQPARSVHGVTFKVITIGLLVAAVLAREGVVCIVFAAPLVYAIGHGVVAVLRLGRRSYAVVPIALLLGLEGLVPGVRVAADQAVMVTHTVALAPAAVARQIAAGPDFSRVEPPLILAMIPMPGHVAGAGVDPGDAWEFVFHADSHGAAGSLICQVTAHRETADGGRVTFRTVADTSVVTRWLDWTSAELEWHATAGGTAVTLTLHFTRGLDPSWYFGPLEEWMVGAGGDVILDSLGLPDAA